MADNVCKLTKKHWLQECKSPIVTITLIRTFVASTNQNDWRSLSCNTFACLFSLVQQLLSLFGFRALLRPKSFSFPLHCIAMFAFLAVRLNFWKLEHNVIESQSNTVWTIFASTFLIFIERFREANREKCTIFEIKSLKKLQTWAAVIIFRWKYYTIIEINCISCLNVRSTCLFTPPQYRIITNLNCVEHIFRRKKT